MKHCHLEFDDKTRPVKNFSKPNIFTKEEDKLVDIEIRKMLEMKVIKEVEHDENEFISPIFLVKKKNNEYRMILNLKELNESIVYHHFKMDTFESTLKLVKQNAYMSSVDLKHAYYSVPIAESDQLKLRFEKSGKLYQYVALPNGLSSAPRIFTKLLKPVYSALRTLGHSNSSFIDDSFLTGDTKEECELNIQDTMNLMNGLGFIIHEKKSVLVPTKKLTFLGNDIDSENMIVTLPFEKVTNLVRECKNLSQLDIASIRQVARVLGLMVSSFSAVDYAPLYYRCIEKAKSDALNRQKGILML